MPRKSITLFAMMLATIVLFPGCKKEKTAELAATQAASGMLCFNSPEEFAEAQQKVLAMSEAERREWEQQQGFKSYATKCNELFEAFEAKGIESDEDIYNFVKENPDYFYIFIDEDGEEYLKSHLEDTPYPFYANERRLFAIHDTVIKVFEHYMIKAAKNDINMLLHLEEGVFDDDFDYFDFSSNDILSREYSCDCDITEAIFRTTKSNNRLYVRFYIGPTGVLNNYRCGYRLRPYHRIAGIWYYCSRTISYNFSVNWKYKDSLAYNSPWVYGGNSASDVNGTGSSCIDGFLLNVYLPVGAYMNDLQFVSFNGWAKTPDTPSCTIVCPNL